MTGPDAFKLRQQLATKYWKLIFSALAVMGPAWKAWNDFRRDSMSFGWTLFLVGIVVVLLVIFLRSRMAFVITRLISGKPPTPAIGSMIFRGPHSYRVDEKQVFHGRKREIDACVLYLERDPFFLIDGDSGCGKSSLLNAGLIPEAQLKYTVMQSDVADDPFGKLLSALLRKPYARTAKPVTKSMLVKVIGEVASHSQADGVGTADANKPILLCIDQAEKLFSTVSEKVRRRFFGALRDAIDQRAVRVVLVIRSDFLSLLLQAFRDVDRAQRVLHFRNYYNLRPFRKEQAKAVLGKMLSPIAGDDPLANQQIDDFVNALVNDLLRPVLDSRLYPGDERIVLPVEMQIVGRVLEEELGTDHFTAQRFRKIGGKLGLLRGYVKTAKDYVERATGVAPEKSLLVLKELIARGEHKTAQTLDTIHTHGLSSGQVAEVLGAFEDKYLVKRIPVEGGQVDGVGSSYRYELIHEHLAQILEETAEPILVKAWAAEERLRVLAASEGVGPNIPQSPFLDRGRRWLRQPIPLVESLRLWRFARGTDQSRMLWLNLRGFCFRLVVGLTFLALLLAAWEIWSRSDKYQIATMISSVPLNQAVSSAKDQPIQREWSRALICAGEFDRALAVAGEIRDAVCARDWVDVAEGLARVNRVGEATRVLNRALADAKQIPDTSSRVASLAILGASVAKIGQTEEANRVLDEALVGARGIPHPTDRFRALCSMCEGLVRVGRTDEALLPIREQGDATSKLLVIQVVVETLAEAGSVNELQGVLADTPGILGEVKSDFYASVGLLNLIERLIQSDRKSEAQTILNSALGVGRQTRDPGFRSHTLSLTAKGLAKMNFFFDASAILPEIDDENDRSEAFTTILEQLSETGETSPPNLTADDALVLVPTTKNESLRDRAFLALAKTFARSRELDKAVEAASNIKDQEIWIHAVGAVAAALAKVGRADEAMGVIDRPSAERGTTIAPQSRGFAADMARRMGLEVADERINTDLRVRCLAAIGKAFASDGYLREARAALDVGLSVARNLENDYFRTRGLAEISGALGEVGEFEGALAVAGEITDDNLHLDALLYIGRALARSGRGDEAQVVVTTALGIAGGTTNDTARDRAFYNVATAFARLRAYRAARLAADQCSSTVDRLRAYKAVLIEYGREHNAGSQIGVEDKSDDLRGR